MTAAEPGRMTPETALDRAIRSMTESSDSGIRLLSEAYLVPEIQLQLALTEHMIRTLSALNLQFATTFVCETAFSLTDAPSGSLDDCRAEASLARQRLISAAEARAAPSRPPA